MVSPWLCPSTTNGATLLCEVVASCRYVEDEEIMEVKKTTTNSAVSVTGWGRVLVKGCRRKARGRQTEGNGPPAPPPPSVPTQPRPTPLRARPGPATTPGPGTEPAGRQRGRPQGAGGGGGTAPPWRGGLRGEAGR